MTIIDKQTIENNSELKLNDNKLNKQERIFLANQEE